jgi:uncharacterized protein YbjT (DUF2867 family)
MKKTILVLGATGMLGKPAAYALKAAGFNVRIMTRSYQKARKLFDSSFETVLCDPMDVSCLTAAMEGCYGVHISLPAEAEQQVAESVAKMAASRGVQRISYISGATVAEENRWFPMVNGKFLAEKAIRESGVPYTILCPTWVMDGLPMFVQQGRAAVFGKQPCPYHWVAADDIARMVAAAYGLGEEANGRFIVHGPEAIRMQEAVKRYCASFHPEIKEVSSMPFWLVKVLAALTRNRGLKGAGELFSYFEKAGEWKNLPQASCALGKPSTTLDAWLEQNKAPSPAGDLALQPAR